MSFEARCPQCIFISNQLGQRTPCLLHLSVAFDPGLPVAGEQSAAETFAYDEPYDYDEPYEFGQLRPTVDRPGPFTIREYVRLQLLRTRIQAEPSPLDSAAVPSVLQTSSEPPTLEKASEPAILDSAPARIKAHSLSI